MKSERNKEIIALRDSGHSYAEIARKYEISTTRVRTLCLQNEAIYNNDESVFINALRAKGLNRVANALCGHYKTRDVLKDQVIKDIKSSSLHWEKVVNIGKVSYDELICFLGIDEIHSYTIVNTKQV